MMYLVSATLKRYEDQGRLREDLPLVRWSVRMRFIMHSSPSTRSSPTPEQGARDLCSGDSFPRAACRSGRRSTRQAGVRPDRVGAWIGRDRLTPV